MALIEDRRESEKMTENKAAKPQGPTDKKLSRHDKLAEERHQRQAEALRANLKKRKSQIRQRDNPADQDT